MLTTNLTAAITEIIQYNTIIIHHFERYTL